MESEEFLLLPVSQLVDIISSDELNVRTEEQVFSAVMAWLKFNVGERRQHLPQVRHYILFSTSTNFFPESACCT
jgi:kelch-like protein 20